jgi:A/G-specific adenine glycosylase
VAASLTSDVVDWFAAAARDLPWRRQPHPWAVLVSEVMLQQTPVQRVTPVFEEWLARWPTPAALAAATPADAVRAWGRLGYPRRALRLHACSGALVRDHGGQVPADLDALLALPGVGAYTARAVLAFAFGRRVPVVDTNVRRVIARLVEGSADAGPPSVRRDLAAADALLPAEDRTAAALSAALMELGATVCAARAPRCGTCPVRQRCAWVARGCPPADARARPTQRWVGTDRQARGALMAVLRAAEEAGADQLAQAWPQSEQRTRALAGLVADGLVEPLPGDRYRLPVGAPA